MQEEPKKTYRHYNEVHSIARPIELPSGVIEQSPTQLQQEIISSGIEMVDRKITEILGSQTMLVDSRVDTPRVSFIPTEPGDSSRAGYFTPFSGEIVLILDKISDKPDAIKKVFIHEYFHFISHNGRDDSEIIDANNPLSTRNNIGFRRNHGIDIREGKEGKDTHHYFTSFNEAVTEQLAIDILPGEHETYADYRGLLGQVIEDAVTVGVGSRDQNGSFISWSPEQVKQYIYVCYFRGDLKGLTSLLQTIYAKFDISEQQFGLMTHRDDLPSVVEQKIISDNPSGPPPSPGQVKAAVQLRIDSKTDKDYPTDIISPDDDGGTPTEHPMSKYGEQYDKFIEEHKIHPATEGELMDGKKYEFDSLNYIIYRGYLATAILEEVKSELGVLLGRLERGEIKQEDLTEQVDQLLFDKYHMSMLSDGFRDFYIYKHSKLGD